MPLIPWRPFFDLDRFFEDDEWLLPAWPRLRWVEPAMDVYETDKEVVAEVNLPGVDPEKVEVEVKNGVLRVSGRIEEEKEEKKKDYWRKEVRKGSFERAVRLPVAVEEDAAEAKYAKGVLKIVMPKAEESKPEAKKVKIKVEE